MIELDQARELLFRACPPVRPVMLDVADAAGCVLAAEVTAGAAVPPFDNSSVDGYAVRSADLAGNGTRLEVLGTVFAGSVADRPVAAGQTWKVMTGAPLPAGADAVVMVEDSSASHDAPLGNPGDQVELRRDVRVGAGVRRAGSDIRSGDSL